MGIYDKLKKYFDETPKEKVLKDWEETKIFDTINSPTIDKFFMHIVNRSTKINKTKVSVKCLHCGRSFIKKLPHKCNTGYRKRNHKWQELTDD
jgi:hypothetical protein